ncbi:DUF5054 domain-containing protein [Paenibacillus montanisoli]|uniref:Glycoside hydrolase n=1 Tax=Paenibacillus montanisoli TaxID=2081970 RepID=A0A328U828_9BACL|nr:DUF5054 domain-containing protein [Paenibacillus montanisoli]RAP77561.1 glycoside hydrolase [Paenibacillus montanisoli]
MKKIHVIFKTHLDIGFTDYAHKVSEQYFQSFIPEAIKLAKQLRLENGREQFVWTTGSWLIHEYLKQASEEARSEMEEAIAQGSIVWHGLPFTTHTELLDPLLFEYGLSIAQRLNARYGKHTIAAKMTDVPGHTIGMVSHMAKYGIHYLHLGVNPASKAPSVPDIFIWRGKDGSELIVNYAGTYGNLTAVAGCDEAMYFAHTGDNAGPPSAEEIKLEFARLAEQYPEADIEASTMNAFAEKLLTIKDRLPVITEEIGDSWIHGAASDPLKISQYRELLRLRDKWLQEGRLDPASPEYAGFCDQLILIPEHTWGMDEKKYLTDFKNYSVRDFHSAREADLVANDAVPAKYSYLGYFSLDSNLSSELQGKSGAKTFSRFERSWQEQRDYLSRAMASLSKDKQDEALQSIASLTPSGAVMQSERELRVRRKYNLGCFLVEFDQDGSICGLTDRDGKVWADERHRLGTYEYETLGLDHYNAWFLDYVEKWEQTHSWADADFGKPGMEFAEPRPAHLRFSPRLNRIAARSEEDYDLVQLRLEMEEECVTVHGAPREVHIQYKFYKEQKKIETELSWFDKQAYRLPEASWFSLNLKVDNANQWKLDKMGALVSPLDVVKNGNRSMHAVNTGVYYEGSDAKIQLETLDAPIVSPGEKRMLRFDQRFAPLEGGMHFNLHNNVWGTNFRMWFEENMTYRFVLRIEDK